jgi:hypothetical protein
MTEGMLFLGSKGSQSPKDPRNPISTKSSSHTSFARNIVKYVILDDFYRQKHWKASSKVGCDVSPLFLEKRRTQSAKRGQLIFYQRYNIISSMMHQQP